MTQAPPPSSEPAPPADYRSAPYQSVNFLPRTIAVERRPDGVVILRHTTPLKQFARAIPDLLHAHAATQPDALWLAQRRGPARDWTTLSYGAGARMVDSVAQGLLDLVSARALDPARPLCILSGNSIEHAVLTLAGMQVGLMVAPVSPAYSILSLDHVKLKSIIALLDPGLIFAHDGLLFQRALAALDLDGRVLVHGERAPPGRASLAFDTLAQTPVTDAVARARAAVGPHTIGKLLLTSGSTGTPKAVINTQEMMCANAAMAQMAHEPRPGDPPMVMVDWMPWNHTMGGNVAFHAILAAGGALYIDDGKPMPGMFKETLRNLREISPTYYANVPSGYAMLASALEKDAALADSFFKNLLVMAYGGATLPHEVYQRMQTVCVRRTGHRLPFVTGWGATETAPTATSTYWESECAGMIGLPLPGVELKMAPVDTQYEMRLRAITVTPGYYKQPELTQAAFDDEGFYKIGDAGVFLDPDDPAQGVLFAGRLAEDFKLATGTFVQVGALRVAALAASPLLAEAVVTAPNHAFVGLLAWPNLEACRAAAGEPLAKPDALVRHPAVVAQVRAALQAYNASASGSSFRVVRALLMAEPPSIDGGELTDKGYINQRATLARRAALVARLYADPPDADVIVVDAPTP